jgi:hypothetical protein
LDSNPAKTGGSGWFANHEVPLDCLLELLIEPEGRRARQQAAEAIGQTGDRLQSRGD